MTTKKPFALAAFLRNAIVLCAGLATLAQAAPLTIDLTTETPAPRATPYGPGTTAAPNGDEIKADSRSFFFDGKPWMPILGEFHFARYPRDEWRDELLKMKSGGINTVSTYVFWIHHEEERGKFDWTGQRSLRDFLKQCQDVGLKAFVRMGPWCHGEVRNGGFPDWVQKSGMHLRSRDPKFMSLVQPFFLEQARQMQGLLWKDGGPVIGVQLDNECSDGGYLLALKAMAQSVGVDVPFYAMTGWTGGIPKEGLIPLFGGYSDGFWGGRVEDYRREFIFADTRAVNDLGAQLTNRNSSKAQIIDQFPYACVELGAGMMSGYRKRIKIVPANVAALALSKLGSGNNMPGYYMYQGGTNPLGKLSFLHEDHPNQLPVKDYDFQTALGACGQVRQQYHLLREQHLFLQDFGPLLARMPAYFPDLRPSNLKDFSVLRWDVRSDGKRGFLFFSNQQPYEPLPEHRDVQFAIKTSAGSSVVPSRPVTIKTGSYGIWPLNLDCDGVSLQYATAQPLCRILDGNRPWYFFSALEGIPVEFSVVGNSASVAADAGVKTVMGERVLIRNIQPSRNRAIGVKEADGRVVSFVVLPTDDAVQFYRATFAGKDRAILSSAAVLSDATRLRLQAENATDLALSMFPPIPRLKAGEALLAGVQDGVFARFDPDVQQPPVLEVPIALSQPAGPDAATLKGTEESSWNDAAVYTLAIPPAAAQRRLILNIHYIGDAARLYVGDTLFDDHFYNGDPFAIALWRIAPSDWPAIRLKILPYSDALLARLPEETRAHIAQAQAAGALDRITITPRDQLEMALCAPPRP
jgi:hypothetical protein